MSGPDDVAALVKNLRSEAGKVLVGQEEAFDLLLTGLLTGGHVLLEGVPGTAKTLMARVLALLMDVQFSRVQCTPDLMPSDVVGTNVFDLSTGRFSLHRGPVFTSVLLVDEINRAPAKTQSALLEVMEEATLSADGVVHELARPFMVVATQNPIDMEGTYILPEAQLDRFLMKLTVGYPSAESEADILRTEKMGSTVTRLTPVLSAQDVSGMIDVIRTVEVAPALEDYIVAIASRTRSMSELRLGVSPRGSLALLRAARAAAAASARTYVTPEDVQDMAPVVLAHRVILQPDAELQGRTGAELISRAMQSVAVPRSVPA